MKRTILFGKIALAVVCAMAFTAQPASARMRVHEMAESPVYKQKAPGMVGRGLLNGITFFVDTIVDTITDTRSGPPVIGTLAGFGRGIGCSALRLGSGAVDIVTFWVPGFNGFPVSDSYYNCLDVSMSAPAATSYQTPTDNSIALEPASSYSPPTETATDTTSTPLEPGQRKYSK